MLKGFVTIATYVPAHQLERLRIIERISSFVNRSSMRHLRGEPADFVEVLRDLSDPEKLTASCRERDGPADAEASAPGAAEEADLESGDGECQPIQLEDIPPWSILSLTETDGSVGKIGLLYRRLQEWNVLEVREFQQRYQTLEVPSGKVAVADGTFITADVITTVQADGERMGLLVVAILIVVLLVALRSVRGTIICMLTMAGAFAMTLGVMVATGTKLGMYNMIVVPAVLGVSIDGAIHMYHRFQETGGRSVGFVLRTTGFAVAAASMTTAGGFAGLLFQRHMGIRSIGELAVIGILSALLAVFLLMPGLLALFAPKPRQATAEGAEEG